MNQSSPNTENEKMQMLWMQFEQSRDSQHFAKNWLALQASIICDVSLAVVVMEQEHTFLPVAIYPESARDTQRLADLIERSLEQKSGLWLKQDSDSSSSGHKYAITSLIRIDDQIKGLVALELTISSDAELNRVMQQLQWGMGWLELGFWRERSTLNNSIIERLKPAVDLLARVLSEQDFKPAVLALVNELARQFACERVSIGFVQKGRIKVEALSHSAQFGQKMNLIRLIEAVMDEVIDQRHMVVWPNDREAMLITRDHEQLATQDGAGILLSIPLSNHKQCYGVITFERPADQEFSDEEIQTVKSIASLAGAALEDKLKLDVPVWKFWKQRLQKKQGEEKYTRNSLRTVAVLIILFFSFVKGEYQLNADMVLEGAIQRVITTPFNGFVEQAHVRAGDLVKKNDLMVKLEDADLRLQRMKWLTERSQLQKQSQDARAKRERAQVTILDSQIAQATAEMDLVEKQLERTHVRAPFDGLVISGDLSQRLGAAVQQGEILFKLTPLNAYRVILNVDESRITDVKVGQKGRLVLTALPGESFPFVIDKITSVATAAEGRNTFRVEARLNKQSIQVRPGMEGVGKIRVDDRLLIGIWTRNLREWLVLQYWSILG
ncbi:MAG: efflux RND transporter periplasmic adaptor subunit [Gammaproteobacteria bacterium]|nr:efflux RND transporter periplasmic adaptor subunit [Gammaproteobacteria bacterium]